MLVCNVQYHHLDSHILLYNVPPETELHEVGGEVVLQHVVFRVYDGGDVQQDGVGGPVQLGKHMYTKQ